jgi:hypothetical protein
VAVFTATKVENGYRCEGVKGLKGEGEMAVATAIWEHCRGYSQTADHTEGGGPSLGNATHCASLKIPQIADRIGL